MISIFQNIFLGSISDNVFHIPQLVSVQTAKIGKTKEVGGARGAKKGSTHSCTEFLPTWNEESIIYIFNPACRSFMF